MLGILDHGDGGIDEVALLLARAPADEHRRALLRERLVARDPGVRALVDHRAHERREILDVAHLHLRALVGEVLLHLGPERSRHVDARGGGALLALVLETAAEDPGGEGRHVGARVREDEVFAARLAHQARKGAVAIEALAHPPPQGAEGVRAAREMDACEVLAVEADLALGRAIARDHVEHSVRQPRLAEEKKDLVASAERGGRGLPHRDVAAEDRGRGQVHGDREEVEGGDREHEALERAELAPVPHARRRERLLVVEPPEEVDVEAEEVDQLADRVDLRLMGGLALSQHARGVHSGAPRPSQEIGGPEEDRRAVLEAHRGPGRPGFHRRVDRRLSLGYPSLVRPGQHLPVPMGCHDLQQLSGRHPMPADVDRDLGTLGGGGPQGRNQLGSLRRLRAVAQNRFIEGRGDGRGHGRILAATGPDRRAGRAGTNAQVGVPGTKHEGLLDLGA